ncbi:hydrogenase maturation factor [Ruminiclostridium sufflavum DSM 19573]|uniref:Hydrogenase maturation factor n=1 Tax=Ruminiclostridium sufflavum DSM 19573 TaxID=1121337 RepID=A0A318XXK4_9FIRM|nr:AIR synthase family protein [Ruminiclostridium sufflavum]PYG87527.1 hydrogenase maturation factor [Ruminiclostridium sufflavum DSM 19573]
MESGKVPNEVLNKIVLSKINKFREDVFLRPGIGEDCAAIAFGDYACVLSTDPITAAVNEAGLLSVHISCNDIASSGVEPLGLLVTILCPVGTSEAELEKVMEEVCITAAELNVEIIGGHTEVTSAVNQIVLSTTCVGKGKKSEIVLSSGAQPGDSIIMTKSAGMEGTAIIAGDFSYRLKGLVSDDELLHAKSFIKSISVVKEGALAGKFGATSMHDITEGGVLGAVWEISEASGAGIIINKDDIPVEAVTEEICKVLDLNALRLISSGCMLITCPDGEGLVRHLQSNGVKAAIIGSVTANKNERLLISKNKKTIEEIEPPAADELYKLK